MLSRKQREPWDAAYASARRNDVLAPETTTLLHLAAAMAVGCDP